MLQLSDYEYDIHQYVTTKNVSSKKAVSDFIYNLLIMRDGIEGFNPAINFRTLGQQWNSMSSTVRNAQKDALVAKLETYNYDK